MPLLRRNTRNTGRHYESLALKHLKSAGLRHISSNYYCRQGEIDLIMLDNDTLVFTEVRYRRNASHGSAVESVTRSKQRKLLSAAQHYLSQHSEHQHRSCRFDVIGITSSDQQPQIHWVKNAFME